MTEGIPQNERSLERETLASLWHTAFRYDWRALCVIDDAVHIIYLGKPNPALILLGPFGGLIMQSQARSAYKRATAVPVEQRITSDPKNITLRKGDVTKIEGSSRKISITTSQGDILKLNRMGGGDLMAMTAGFGPG